MQLLDLTLPTVAENLALDEALLETAEAGSQPCEVLRLWESPQTAVIVGRSSPVDIEVNGAYCEQNGITVWRRSSGGASVLIGPGCLMYAVVLSYERAPHLQLIEQAHRHVMQVTKAALQSLVPEVAFDGTSDLTFNGKKFSGNSLRCKRTHLLYHGTLLFDFPLAEVGRCLSTAPRQPEYRAGRSHDEFVTNLPTRRELLRAALVREWQADKPLADWPQALTSQLVRERYSQTTWNRRL